MFKLSKDVNDLTELRQAPETALIKVRVRRQLGISFIYEDITIPKSSLNKETQSVNHAGFVWKAVHYHGLHSC